MTLDRDALRQAIFDNANQPYGTARATRAEVLLEHADSLADAPVLVEALSHLIRSYVYAKDEDRLLVPFARLLRIWDSNPDAFDDYDTHGLFWFFKWASTGMLKIPGVSLAAIEGWRAEMGRRYALAGHSERAVWQADHSIATHIGDAERAAAALTKWWTAPRDSMADCVACEISERGDWFAQNGDDAAALEAWGPVLSGAETCMEEPHLVLAKALLPLIRQGRFDEACSAHLRGYPMTRSSESLGVAVAAHLEFCALTGNEARGLELLAEQPGYLDSDINVSDRTRFLAAAALLMDRLVAKGFSEVQVPGPDGESRTAAELAVWARRQATAGACSFDARNGTDAYSRTIMARLDATPLLDWLPLGTRSRIAPSPATTEPTADEPTTAEPAAEAFDPEAEVAPEKGWPSPAVEAAMARFEAAADNQDHAGVKDALLAALNAAGTDAPPTWRATQLTNLGEAAALLGDLPAAVRYAREATHWDDLEPSSLYPRYRLAAHLMASGRLEEAGPVLEHTLLDLEQSGEEGAEVQTRWWLGEVFSRAGDALAAAQQWTLAAAIAQTWDEQIDHATLSHMIAWALDDAGQPDEAAAAYARAAALFAELGRSESQCAALRAHAWLVADGDHEAALELMKRAVSGAEAALAEDPASPEGRSVLAESLRQSARLQLHLKDNDDAEAEPSPALLRDAYVTAVRAAELFAGLDDGGEGRLRSLQHAAELAFELDDLPAARLHVNDVLGDTSAEADDFREWAQWRLESIDQGSTAEPG